MDPTSGDPWQPLLDKLTQLKSSWPAPAWSWDARYRTIGASFRIELSGRARASFVHVLPLEWTPATVNGAPANLRAFAAQTGGLRAGQLLFGGDAIGDVQPFGLWWPWGAGDTITLRIGLLDLAPAEDPFPRVLEMFGVRV